MGSNLTSLQRLERLGIPPNKHASFKANVLKYLEGHWGVQFHTVIQDDEIGSVAKSYMKTNQHLEFRDLPVSGRHPQPSETEVHGWLSELFHTWINERERQESQEDPSYSANVTDAASSVSKTKKRKRTSEPSRLPKKPSYKPKKSYGGQDTAVDTLQQRAIPSVKPLQGSKASSDNIARSPTIALSIFESGPNTLPHIPYAVTQYVDSDDDENAVDDGDLPSLSEIIAKPSDNADTGVRALSDCENVTSISKGKMPVRDPPGPAHDDQPDMQGPQTPQSNRANPDTCDSSVEDDSMLRQVRTPSHSPRPETQDLQRQRSFKSMRDIEDVNATHSRSPTSSTFANALISGSLPKSRIHSIKTPITPPPTTRQTRFIDPTLYAPADDINPNTSTPAVTTNHAQVYDERSAQFVNSLADYIRDCELHNLAKAEASTNSPREIDVYHVRAKAFSNLYRDISSRIAAFLDEEKNVTGKSSITSYCLWP